MPNLKFTSRYLALAHKATFTNPLVWSSFLYPCQHEIQFLAPTHPPTQLKYSTHSHTHGLGLWSQKNSTTGVAIWRVYRALFKHLWLTYLPLTNCSKVLIYLTLLRIFPFALLTRVLYKDLLETKSTKVFSFFWYIKLMSWNLLFLWFLPPHETVKTQQ